MIGVLIAIACIILPVALVTMLLMTASRKNRDDISGVERSVRNIYIYTILIILLIVIVYCSIYALRVGLDILLPEETTYIYYNAFDKIEKNESITKVLTAFSAVIVCVPLFLKYSKIAKETNNS